MAPLSLCEMTLQNRVLFLQWKAIKPMEMSRKLDKNTRNTLQNAKRHRIHNHQKGNAASFNYPPGGLIDVFLWFDFFIFQVFCGFWIHQRPRNIMLDCRGYGKVCDMGLARFVVGKTNTQARKTVAWRRGKLENMAIENHETSGEHDGLQICMAILICIYWIIYISMSMCVYICVYMYIFICIYIYVYSWWKKHERYEIGEACRDGKLLRLGLLITWRQRWSIHHIIMTIQPIGGHLECWCLTLGHNWPKDPRLCGWNLWKAMLWRDEHSFTSYFAILLWIEIPGFWLMPILHWQVMLTWYGFSSWNSGDVVPTVVSRPRRGVGFLFFRSPILLLLSAALPLNRMLWHKTLSQTHTIVAYNIVTQTQHYHTQLCHT